MIQYDKKITMKKLKEIIKAYLEVKREHERAYNVAIVEKDGTVWLAYPNDMVTLEQAKEFYYKNNNGKMHITYERLKTDML